MPLDTYAHLNGLPNGASGFPDTLGELRLQLIGNRELKIRVLQEPQFVEWLLQQLQQDLDKVERDSALPGIELSRNIHDKVVILRILACFVADLQNSDDKTAVDGASLRGCVPLMARLFEYVGLAFLPSSSSATTSSGHGSARNESEVVQVKSDFQKVLCDALWIVLVFANSTNVLLDEKCYENLWKLTTTLLICDDTKTSRLALRLRTAVVSSLSTLPFLLKGAPKELTEKYASSLLRLCLLRLHKEFAQLHNHYVDGLPTQGHFLEKVSPNIIADKRLLRDFFEIDFITSLVVAAAQLLNHTKERNKALPLQLSIFTSKEVFLCMVLLLKCEECHLLNIATLNLIHFYLNALEDLGTASEEIIFKTYEKLFPRIIELLDTDLSQKHSIPPFLQLPVSVLSGLCLKYPRMSLHLHNTNVDMKIMKDLQALIKKTPVFSSIFKLKVASKQGTKLADFTTLTKHRIGGADSRGELGAHATSLEQVSDYLQLLSVYTSSNEDYRRRVTKFLELKASKALGPNFLCLSVFEFMDDYRFLIQQALLSYEVLGKLLQESSKQDQTKILAWFGKNLGVIYTLIEHPIFTQTIYLVRSLSRSIGTLRTFFVDCNSIKSVFDVDDDTTLNATEGNNTNEDIIDIIKVRYNREASFKRRGSFVSSLLEILGLLDNVKYAMQYFTKANPELSLQFAPPRKTLCVKKVILLASIANFILDFSSFRYEIVNHDSFLVDLARVFQTSASEEEIKYSEDEEREIAYEHLREQLTVLQVVKSYLYNENEENRKVLWDFIPLSLIFEKSLYGLVGPIEEDAELHALFVQHKILAFEIMRNLTAASSFFSEAIRESYLEYVKEEAQHGHTSAPSTWHEYLLQNLLSYNLFADDGKVHKEEEFLQSDEFFFTLIKNSEYVRLLVGINYLEDHRYTNISVFKKLDFPLKAMIEIWKRILDAKLLDKLEQKLCGHNLNERVKLANQLIELKFSIDWILINLTWQDDAFGYQVPDKVSFGLLDTVGHRTHSDPHSEDRQLFNSSNIVIEESEDEEGGEERHTPAQPEDEDGEMSAEDKAKLLHRYQFSQILQRIIIDMSKPKFKSRGNSKVSSIERFDLLNANNLYEKSKTALSQITGLVSGHATNHESGPPGAGQARTEERHPLRRMSNIISSRDGTRIRRDVNRGGEGFGYDSADDVDESGGTERQGDEEEEEDEDDASDTNAEQSDMDDVVDIDDYWVR